VSPIEAPVEVTRASGDVHPGGNPHYLTDPENGRLAARALAARFSALAPADAAAFNANLAAFEKKLDRAFEEWNAALKPYAGSPFVSYHRNLIYFARRFGLEPAGEIEPKPGIPPTAQHTGGLIALMKEKKIRLIITQPYYEKRTPAFLARETGAQVAVFAMGPGGADGGIDYISTVGNNVRRVADALKGASQ
jgi:zinc/manganese transport system substrate-binding protein